MAHLRVVKITNDNTSNVVVNFVNYMGEVELWAPNTFWRGTTAT